MSAGNRYSERESDQSSPGVPNDNRPLNSELRKCFVQQFGLRSGHPEPTAGPFAVAEPGSVKDYNPIVPQQSLGHAASVVIITGDGITVKEQDGRPLTSIAVVQPESRPLP